MKLEVDVTLRKMLVGLVGKLVKQKKEKTPSYLCGIGKVLVEEARFELEDGSQLIPIWVEAYYANPNQGFKDPTVDANKDGNWQNNHQQVNHPFTIYFAGPTEKRRRADLVLSSGEDYALSYLLKVAILINPKRELRYLKTCMVRDIFMDQFEQQKKVRLVIGNNSFLDESGSELKGCVLSSKRSFGNVGKQKNKPSSLENDKTTYQELPGLAVYRILKDCLEYPEAIYSMYAKMADITKP